MQDEDEQEYGELIELEGQEQDDVEDTEDGGAIVRLDEEDPKAGESEFYANLADGIIPEQELISYCEGLEFGTLEFSEGETAATKLLNLLSKLPPMVSFGEVAGGTFQYSEEDLDPHAKALRLVEESEGKMDYVEALKKTMFS